MKRTDASRRTIAVHPLVFFALSALAALTQVEAKKECIEVTPGNVKKLAQDSHLLLKFDKEFPSGDPEEQYKELCGRYEGTPNERISDLVIGQFGIDIYGDTDKKKKAIDIAEKFRAGDEDEWPTYVLLKKGTTESSEAIKFEGEKTVEGVTTFIKEQLDINVGTMLYYIETLDRMAARFVGVDENGDTKAQLERKLYAYVAKIMIFLYRGDAKDVAVLYGKFFSSILQEGKDYVTKNQDRLDGMLKSDRSLSNAKREEVAQRLHILQKFTEPVEVTPEENRKFILALAWYTVLLGSMLLVSISLLLFEEKGSDEKEAGKEKTGSSADDKDDEKEGDNTKVETKKDK